MREYTVVFSTEEMVGNDTDEMTIDAPDLESAYEIVNEQYPDLIIDQIFEAR